MENTKNLKFSVSICVYGGDNPEFFDTSLESVFDQTLPPDEVILVVDGPVSTQINDVIRRYSEKYDTLKVIRLKENSGLGNARKAALKACANNLVAMADADDICPGNRFEKQVKAFAENENLSIVGGQIDEFIGTKENIVGRRCVPTSDAEIKAYMKKRCPMNHVSVMLKKDKIDSVGGYVDWYWNEDYYLWVRMALAGMEFCNLPDSLVYVRIGEQMYRRRGGLKYFISEARLQKYMKEHKMIGFGTYMFNVGIRLVLQVLMPNRLRGFVFKHFAREKIA